MLGLASGLVECGMPLDLVLVRAEGALIDLVPESVRLIDLDSHRSVASALKFLLYLRRERPAAILSTPLRTNVVALIAKLLIQRRIRVVARQDNTFTEEFDDGSFRQRMMLRVLKWLLPMADCIVAVSKGVADDLRSVIPVASHKVTTIYNPVVWPDHAEKAAAPVEHPWLNDDGAPVILSVGRLTTVKDHATLLRAFAQVLRSRQARLVILGVGPERENLLELAARLDVSRQVDLPGFELNPFSYMSRSNVFVLSSRYEGFANVLVQAMACGTPVVSTDCRSGSSEILEDGKWGRLVPVGDWCAMAEAIIETLDNPIQSDLLIARASTFSADASIDRFLEILTGSTS